MLTSRRTKLLIAVAILVVGVGAAFLFRREEAVETPTASKKTAAPDVAARSSRGSDMPPSAGEPSLAGRIEPYGWDNRPADPSDLTVAERVAASASGADSEPDSVASHVANNQSRTSTERPASYRSSANGAGALLVTPPKRQTVDRPSEPGPAELPERSSNVFERFADHRPLAGASATGKRHRINDGDTLAAIAQRYLGAEERYLDLFEHNRDVLATPELLPIGKELRIPPPDFVRRSNPVIESRSTGLTAVAPPLAPPPDFRPAPEPQSSLPASTPPNPSAQQTYVVQAHDTLALIARKVYGDIGRQSELIAANQQQLRTPQDLRPGMTLVVPRGGKSE